MSKLVNMITTNYIFKKFSYPITRRVIKEAYSDRELLARIVQWEAGGEGELEETLKVFLFLKNDLYFCNFPYIIVA